MTTRKLNKSRNSGLFTGLGLIIGVAIGVSIDNLGLGIFCGILGGAVTEAIIYRYFKGKKRGNDQQ